MSIAEPIAFAALAALDQEHAVSELEDATATAGRPDLVARLAHRLGKAPAGGFVIGIEAPRNPLHYREASEPARLLMDVSRSALASSRDEEDDVRWLETDVRWLPVAAGVALAIGEGSPMVELDRRRRLVDARRADVEAARIEEARARKASEDRAAEYNARHGSRTKRFSALSREAQLLYIAAGEALVQQGDTVRAVAAEVFAMLARTIERHAGPRGLPLPPPEVFPPTAEEWAALARWQKAHPEIASEPIPENAVDATQWKDARTGDITVSRP
jgi:hypothetical protein